MWRCSYRSDRERSAVARTDAWATSHPAGRHHWRERAYKDQLAGKPQLVGPFDAVRAIPEVIDGIRCNCGCAHSDGFYSLLSCYEGKDAMARECAICLGQGRLAVRLHKAGKSLDAIRAAVDAKFG